MEASKFPEEKRITSHSEIKLACKQHTSTQWQMRWEQSDTGRDFFKYYPKVEFKDSSTNHAKKHTVGDFSCKQAIP